MRRKTACTVCLCSLMLFLMGWMGSTISASGAKEFHWPPIVQFLWWPVLLLINIAALVLGIVGLARYDRTRFKQGKKQAIWAIVLSGITLFSAVVGVVVGAYRQSHGAVLGGTPKREDVPQYNCSVLAPEGWVKITPKTIGVDTALLGYQRAMPEAYMLLVAEQTAGDGITMDSFVVNVKHIMEKAVSVEEMQEEKADIGPLKFRRISASGRLAATGLEIHYENWLLSDSGTYWRMVIWGPSSARTTVTAEARKFAENFRVLVPGKRMAITGNLTDIHMPEWGIEAHLAGDGWNKGGKELTKSPLFRFAAIRGNEAIIAVPLSFEEQPPDLEALARALFSTMTFQYPLGEGSTEAPINSAGCEGMEYRTSRELEGNSYRYILRIIRGKNRAWMLAGWTNGSDLSGVQAALDRIKLADTPGDSSYVPQSEKAPLSIVFNEMGLSYYRRKQYNEAAKWFDKAYGFDKDSEVSLRNWASALQKAKRSKEALAGIEPELSRFPNALKLQMLQVTLLADNWEPDAANARFYELIGKGLKDEAVLLSWLKQLDGMNRQDLGEQAAARWIEKYPSVDARRYQAEIVARGGEPERATALLEKLASENPDNEQVACELGEDRNEAGDFHGAEDAVKGVLSKTPGHARALQVRGWSQMGLKRYREAKATFELAAQSAPDDQDIEASIRRASRALGQGQNSAIKQPLSPVELPEAVARKIQVAAAGAKYSPDVPAVILSRSTAYEFTKGKPLRWTMRRRILILNQTGVASFNSLDIPFNPDAERIFINKLQVEDADGKKIADGSADDAYVRDSEWHGASDNKILQIPVPGLKRGCTLTYEITMEDRSPQSEFPFTRYLFGYHYPCAVDAIVVSGDVSGVKDVVENTAIEKTQAKGVVSWMVRNQTGYEAEPLATRFDTQVPTLWLGTAKSTWAQLGKEYLADIADRLQPDAKAVSLANELCKGLKTDREKIEVLSRHVQKEIEYQAVEFGVRARQPNTVKDILEHRFGDCKDHALLLVQLLRAAKIDSHLALVQTVSRVQPDLPSLDQFDHMVVHVPSLGKSWLIDPTDKELALTQFGARNLWDSHAFILEAGNSRLVPPLHFAPDDSCHMDSRCTIAPSGSDWQVNESITFTGYYAADIRDDFAGESQAEQTRRAQGLLRGRANAELVSFKFENLDDLDKPARLDFVYKVRNAIKVANGKARGTIPVLMEKDYLDVAFVQKRQTPFRFRYPFHLTSVVSLNLPHPATELSKFSAHGGEHFVSWKMAPASNAELSFDFRAKTGEWKAGEYGAFYDEWDSARRAWDSEIEWKVE